MKTAYDNFHRHAILCVALLGTCALGVMLWRGLTNQGMEQRDSSDAEARTSPTLAGDEIAALPTNQTAQHHFQIAVQVPEPRVAADQSAGSAAEEKFIAMRKSAAEKWEALLVPSDPKAVGGVAWEKAIWLNEPSVALPHLPRTDQDSASHAQLDRDLPGIASGIHPGTEIYLSDDDYAALQNAVQNRDREIPSVPSNLNIDLLTVDDRSEKSLLEDAWLSGDLEARAQLPPEKRKAIRLTTAHHEALRRAWARRVNQLLDRGALLEERDQVIASRQYLNDLSGTSYADWPIEVRSVTLRASTECDASAASYRCYIFQSQRLAASFECNLIREGGKYSVNVVQAKTFDELPSDTEKTAAVILGLAMGDKEVTVPARQHVAKLSADDQLRIQESVLQLRSSLGLPKSSSEKAMDEYVWNANSTLPPTEIAGRVLRQWCVNKSSTIRESLLDQFDWTSPTTVPAALSAIVGAIDDDDSPSAELVWSWTAFASALAHRNPDVALRDSEPSKMLHERAAMETAKRSKELEGQILGYLTLLPDSVGMLVRSKELGPAIASRIVSEATADPSGVGDFRIPSSLRHSSTVDDPLFKCLFPYIPPARNMPASNSHSWQRRLSEVEVAPKFSQARAEERKSSGDDGFFSFLVSKATNSDQLVDLVVDWCHKTMFDSVNTSTPTHRYSEWCRVLAEARAWRDFEHSLR